MRRMTSSNKNSPQLGAVQGRQEDYTPWQLAGRYLLKMVPPQTQVT